MRKLANDRIVAKPDMIELVPILVQDRHGLNLIGGNVAEVFEKVDLFVEGSPARVVALLQSQLMRASMAIIKQQVSAFLMAHQIQAIVDKDQCDPSIERVINRRFADCTVVVQQWE